MDSKSSGAICVDGNHLIAADIEKKLYVWKIGVTNPQRILKSEENIYSLITTSEGYVMGAGKTKFFLWRWEEKVQPICHLEYQKR